MTPRSAAFAVLVVALAPAACATEFDGQQLPDFVDVESLIPDIALDLRYFTSHNFIGRPIPGYEAPKCLLTRSAAEALGRVQEELGDSGLSLKVYDCYRPQSAVDAFVEWADDLDDRAMKAEFYPSVDKADLFRDGYIAERSGHSRGSTVDLTIVPVPSSEPDPPEPTELRSCEDSAETRFPDAGIDMGTGYDCFSVRSHTLSSDVTPQQRANRLLLKHLMETHGFVNLPEEWWHFTLDGEPYPESYFDFPVN